MKTNKPITTGYDSESGRLWVLVQGEKEPIWLPEMTYDECDDLYEELHEFVEMLEEQVNSRFGSGESS